MASPEREESEGEESGGEATSLLQPLPKGQGRRPRGDEIRDKYRLRERYSKMKTSRNGTGAVPGSSFPLSDVRSPSQGGGGSGGLQATSQVEENRRKIVERGEKISVLAQKSRGLKTGAMGFANLGAQLVSQKSRKKDKVISTMQPLQQPSHSHDSTQNKKTTVDQQTQQTNYQTHTLPEHHHNRHPPHPLEYHHKYHPSQSPSHTFPVWQLPHVVSNYGTVMNDQSPTTPTYLLYNKKDDAIHSHYEEVVEQKTDGKRKECCGCCGCCRIM